MWIKQFFKSISDLNGDSILNEVSVAQLKKLIQILVVDDNAFSFLEPLRRYEFNLQQKNDLTLLTDVESYDIILCDIRGVGKFLESEFEGANLIKELKTKYPTKTIIAYTANEYDANFQKYLAYADDIVPKGSYALEDWVSLLEQKLKDCADPIKFWKRTRQNLLESGMSTFDVAKYESQFVKAVKTGDFESLKKLYSKKHGRAANIMLELSTSIIAKVITNTIQ